MRLSDQVIKAFKDAVDGEYEAALVHALITVDATARRLFPTIKGNRERYMRCLRDYYWLLEPMVGVGVNFVETRFSNIHLSKTTEPDFAEILYEKFRCTEAHGEERSTSFSLTLSHGQTSTMRLAKDTMCIPDRIVWALLSIAVLAHVNAGERSDGDWHFTLGGEGPYYVSDWWGREADFRPHAARFNTVRVTTQMLHRLREAAEADAVKVGGAHAEP